MKFAPHALILAFVLPLAAFAESGPQVIPLWPNGAPGFESRKNEPEQAKDYWVRSINNPSLTVFRPDPRKANGCAVVVAPGGGFRELVFNAEGKEAADNLTALGVTVFVLKYRLPNQEGSPYKMEHVRQDAQRALRVVRSRAGDFGVDPNRVGMLGFSAGGQLVMMVAFDPAAGDPQAADPVDRQNGRPNFEMIVYPGGPAPASIPHDTGPAFIIAANDDDYGCDQVAFDLTARFRAAKVPVEYYLIAQGRHAFNMGYRSEYLAVRHWPNRMADWLNDRGLLNARPPVGVAK